MATVEDVAWSVVMTFSTGKSITIGEAVCGLNIGSYSPIGIFSGYDYRLSDLVDLTPAEECELADYMIAQWMRFKAARQ